MKTKLYTLLLSAALTLGLTACNEKWEAGELVGDGNGRLATSSLLLDVVNAEQVVEQSRSTIDLSNFIITIYNTKGELVNNWTYAEMPELPVFPVGDYTVKVISHKQEKAAWEAPYFEGSKDFTIKKDEITDIGTVTCKFCNIKVTVKFSDALKKAASDNVQVLVRANDEGSLVFKLGETRSGYFEALEGSTTLTTTFTGTVAGYDEEIIDVYTDLAAGQHRIITYSLKNGNGEVPDETGKIDPIGGIGIDVSITDEHLGGNVNPGDEDIINGETRPGHEDLPEDPNRPDDPTPPTPVTDAATFTSEMFPDFNAVYNSADLTGDAIVNIHCEKGFAKLIVTIDSDGLTPDVLEGVGLAAAFDLVTGKTLDGSKDLSEGLTGLGFKVKDDVKGKTDLEFDITEFVPLLGIYPGMNKFIIDVTDNDGNTSSITLKIQS